MNPLVILPLLSYTLVAVRWPAQVDAHRRAAMLLLIEALAVGAAIGAGKLLEPLATPNASGLRWGEVLLLVTGYLYVCGRGVVLVRSVLELPTLQMRRDEDRTAGAIELSRGRMIGALERGLALTLVCAIAFVLRPLRPAGPAVLSLVGVFGLGVWSLSSVLPISTAAVAAIAARS